MKTRPFVSILLALVVFSFIVWSALAWRDARAGAQSAAAAFDACQRLEMEINRLRDQPRRARAATLDQPEMAKRIEDAAQKSGIDKRNLERIAPGEPRRIKDSVFLESPTQITLGHVTLNQLIALLHTLSVGAEGQSDLRVDAIRMGAPRGVESGNTWGAEVSVSYLVYSPKTEPAISEVR